MEDKELYNKFLNGDEEALNKIIAKYKNNLIYFITRYTKNLEASEDIFQDVILYILEKKEMYNSKYSLKTFLYMIAKSRAINYIKKEKNYTDIEDILDTHADTKLLEEIVCSNETEEEIKETMGNLKTEYQIVLYLTRNRKYVL